MPRSGSMSSRGSWRLPSGTASWIRPRNKRTILWRNSALQSTIASTEPITIGSLSTTPTLRWVAADGRPTGFHGRTYPASVGTSSKTASTCNTSSIFNHDPLRKDREAHDELHTAQCYTVSARRSAARRPAPCFSSPGAAWNVYDRRSQQRQGCPTKSIAAFRGAASWNQCPGHIWAITNPS